MSDTTCPLYVSIATALQALKNARNRDEITEWEARWEEYLERCATVLPHGGGFDVAPIIETDTIVRDRILIRGSYHLMDEHGGYHGWVDYAVKIGPSLTSGFVVTITGARGELRELIAERFEEALSRPYPREHFHLEPTRRVAPCLPLH